MRGMMNILNDFRVIPTSVLPELEALSLVNNNNNNNHNNHNNNDK